MARAYLVTYDLNRPGQNYAALHEAIKNLGRWWKYLESTWIVLVDDKTAAQVSQSLRQQMDDGDHLLVIRVCDDCDGWLNEKAWEWIRKHVPSC